MNQRPIKSCAVKVACLQENTAKTWLFLLKEY